MQPEIDAPVGGINSTVEGAKAAEQVAKPGEKVLVAKPGEKVVSKPGEKGADGRREAADARATAADKVGLQSAVSMEFYDAPVPSAEPSQ